MTTETEKSPTLAVFRQKRVYSDDLWRDCEAYRDNQIVQTEGIAGWIYEGCFYIQDTRSWPEEDKAYARKHFAMTDADIAWVLITNHEHILPLDKAERMLFDFVFNEAPPTDEVVHVIAFEGEGRNEAELQDQNVMDRLMWALSSAGWRFNEHLGKFFPPRSPAEHEMAKLLEAGIGMFGAVEPPWAKAAASALDKWRTSENDLLDAAKAAVAPYVGEPAEKNSVIGQLRAAIARREGTS